MKLWILFSIIMATGLSACSQENKNNMQYNKLTPEEEKVILHKGTERPYSGKYVSFNEEGIYLCKRCNAPLFKSLDKFDSECGWPSFDDEIEGAVKRKPDIDGQRTEIICANCGSHLGHVFEGERFTEKNVRHCVNSISLQFLPVPQKPETTDDLHEAIFAGGCFWGVEYYMQKVPGVISTTVGYTGGLKPNPTYEEVCSHSSGHIEAVKVVFDPAKTSFEELARLFFEIHDPTQQGGQGPDIGQQYISVIFYMSDDQKKISEKLIRMLTDKGYRIATELRKATVFWEAEKYHQDYYLKNGALPYCHAYKKRF
ncbi:MAG: bifunctional methionine sulfoxide reductase B/A protein [Bacteroidales bacterium]|nr:bifunctional methionine sulfoxide reductase B/A protein [Bacteroidales bacterium]